jgi:hypothetical protein
MERKTGYSNHIDVQIVQSSDVDYRDLAQSLGSETCRFALIQSLINNTAMLNKFIEEQLISTEYTPVKDTANFQKAAKLLLERNKVTTSTLEHMQAYSGIQGRLQAQQNVVSWHAS